jgi:run domain Beclin-1 interacting cysteine-rich containing protein
MTKQNYLCPGCGIKAVRAYAHKFRYCEYYGKYFCSGCHKEQKARIPARILENWDFEHYSVSTSAYKFLQAYRDLPLFHVADLNPKLYEKAKNLKQMRDRRVQFNYLHQFMSFCRFGDKVRKVFENLRFPHWLGDPDIWSITDFDNVVNGNMLAELAKLFAVSEEHIKKCEVRIFNRKFIVILLQFFF